MSAAEGGSNVSEGPASPRGQPGASARAADPGAIRVSPTGASRLDGDRPIVISPPPPPVEPLRDQLAESGVLGGVRDLPPDDDGLGTRDLGILFDGGYVAARIEWLDASRAILLEDVDGTARRTSVTFGPRSGADEAGIVRREVVVDGWRFELDIEPERRAALRERARRGHEAVTHSGELEVRAIIAGRIVAVSVAEGDPIAAGQQLLVLEAMKMQNELRAPRDGSVARLSVRPGQTVDVGELLLVIS
ncbi:MAG TPA: acetyl-CoA carboxylase biotin carboxyl carrier protein subunit [Candidatus Limnocylindrales bacterium]